MAVLRPTRRAMAIGLRVRPGCVIVGKTAELGHRQHHSDEHKTENHNSEKQQVYIAHLFRASIRINLK